MSKTTKRTLKRILVIVCVLLVSIAGIGIYFVSLPQPVVWLLRNQFGEEHEIQNIENYAVMLANEGYAVVRVNYEWASEIQYPGQVRQ